MVGRIFTLAMVAGLCGVLVSEPARANPAWGAAYENSKPQNGGLRPSTRNEYMRCLTAWAVVGHFQQENPNGLLGFSADLNKSTTYAMIQHWAVVTYQAYQGLPIDRRESDRLKFGNAFAADFYGDGREVRTMQSLGTCYVEPGARASYNNRLSFVDTVDEGFGVPYKMAGQASQQQQQQRQGGGVIETQGSGTSGLSSSSSGAASQAASNATQNSITACRRAGGEPMGTRTIPGRTDKATSTTYRATATAYTKCRMP